MKNLLATVKNWLDQLDIAAYNYCGRPFDAQRARRQA